MADGLIDFGTKEFVVVIIAKCYSPIQVRDKFTLKFLSDELEKIKCFNRR